jgi:hypothetical protein
MSLPVNFAAAAVFYRLLKPNETQELRGPACWRGATASFGMPAFAALSSD